MEEKLLLAFFKEQYYVFGICPCCGDIFQLSDCLITVRHKHITLPEHENIIDLQEKNVRQLEKLEELEGQFDEKKYAISELKYELKVAKDNAEITRYKKEGRKQALSKSKKFIGLFHKKNLDPRDARLIFSPIEFLVFDGLTEYKETENLVFLSKKPDNRGKEKINESIYQALKKGNIDFQLIRITDEGKIIYESN
jgi:predicted Holliday junction resolvase-like endonuclease